MPGSTNFNELLPAEFARGVSKKPAPVEKQRLQKFNERLQKFNERLQKFNERLQKFNERLPQCEFPNIIYTIFNGFGTNFVEALREL